MEDLLENQNQIMQGIEQLLRNFKKDGAERKTSIYVKKRLELLDKYWEEFQSNHLQLEESEERGYTYFSENYYQKTRKFYNETRAYIQQYKVTMTDPKIVVAPTIPQPPLQAAEAEQSHGQGMGSTDQDAGDIQQQSTSKVRARSPAFYTSQGNSSKLEEMLRKQKSNFMPSK